MTIFFGPRGSSVTEQILPHGDPNVAGIARRILWTVPRGTSGWVPRGDLSRAGAGTAGIIWLRGGTVYTIRAAGTAGNAKPGAASGRPSGATRAVDLAFFNPRAGTEPRGARALWRDLTSPAGVDLYPEQDGVLLLQWETPATDEGLVVFQVDERRERRAQREPQRRVVYVDP